MTEKDNAGPRNVFNIGSQQAANINNVAGDMNIAGGQQITVTLADARRDIALLQQGLNGVALPSTDRQTAAQALAGAAQELAKPDPNKHVVASRLETFAQVLSKVGGVATASVALLEPLQRLAVFLGPVGQAVLHLLV